MTTICRALWLDGPDRPGLRVEELGPLATGSVEIASRFGAISRGTEALVAAGHVPESEHERMRAPLQAGDFPFPVKYGYSTVGEIVAGPPERLGQTVFCLHPHQDRFQAPAAMAVPVPDDVPAKRAVLAANMETALNVVWDAGIAPGDRVAIVGGGLVGLLVAWLAARIPGTDTCLVELNPERAVIAQTLGCRFASPAGAPADCDVVVHASASAAGLATAIEAAGFEARIVELSWYGDRPVSVPLGGAFHSRRLQIVASQVGHVPPERRARWSLGRRMATALSLLADPRLDALVSGETRFADLPASYAGILADPATLCHRIRYD
ncbi:zinc-dependent alcohol dehydrogenase [Aurantimonas coralicida]|uniref:zinc-dependent alcohol dehydrogenase n=1 Tax=Aurantimonas coralicida TaxID=182270 RepID=UPI001D1913AF|nr:zinc-binding alcohol dehydrogenase [Aurantimonas coralicida]MCC4297778.1 zinc-binding alcohol dehydrogenase [Aurantimonas coralicida]